MNLADHTITDRRMRFCSLSKDSASDIIAPKNNGLLKDNLEKEAHYEN